VNSVRGGPPAGVSVDGSRRVAWFHCFCGIAGDMALASLLDAGADFDEVRAMLALVPIDDWHIEVAPVLRGGVAATRIQVFSPPTDTSRPYLDIARMIDKALLPPRVQRRSLATFEAIAHVESRIHRCPVDEVHFHEVGGIDSIVDIVGTCAALEVLGIDQIRASPVALGVGTIATAHGVLPNPAPAVMALLAGAPTYGRDLGVELTTPTGAGFLAALATGFGPLPPMTVETAGYGAGTREIDGLANVVQVVIGAGQVEGETSFAALGGDPGQPVSLLEVNVDDVTGEVLAHAVATLLDHGALDAWVTPIMMKKGRPGHCVSVLVDAAIGAGLAALLASETGSLGIRWSDWQRRISARQIHDVEVGTQAVRVKVSPGRVKAEHDDAAVAAESSGLPLREVSRRAEEAWHRSNPPGDQPRGLA